LRQRFSEARGALQTEVKKTLPLFYALKPDGKLDRASKTWNVHMANHLLKNKNWSRKVAFHPISLF
jgi:hypothetical protein